MAIALAGTVGYWRLSAYVHSELAPQVESTLLKMFDRPVEMGEVEGFSPVSLRFGETVLPPTDSDRDQGRVDAVQVHFNPLEVLFHKQLSLTVTLVNPDLFLDQNPDGIWLSTQINELDPGPIKINLSQLRLQQGTLALFPASISASTFEPISKPKSGSHRLLQTDASPLAKVSQPSPAWLQTLDPQEVVVWENVRGTVQLSNDNRDISLDLKSQLAERSQTRSSRLPHQSGHLHIDGVVNVDQADDAPLFLGDLQTQRLPLVAIAPVATAYIPEKWAPIIGAAVTDGMLHSKVRMRVAKREQDGFAGPLSPAFTLWGKAQIKNGAIQLLKLPNPIDGLNGQFVFKGERITLKKIRGRYGDIRANASGRLHLQDGYNIVAEIPSLSIRQILEATGLELPLEAKGAFKSRLKITGDLDSPSIAGTITNKGTMRVDKLRMKTVQARIRATLDTLNISTIDARPAVGGSIRGSGQLTWQGRPTLDLGIVTQDLPGDAIFRRLLAERVSDWLPNQGAPGGDPRNGAKKSVRRGHATSGLGLGWTNPDTGAPLTLGTIASNIKISGPLDRLRAIAEVQAPQASFPTTGSLIIEERGISVVDMNTRLGRGSITTNAVVDLDLEQWQGTVDINELALNQLPLTQLPWDQLPLDGMPPNPFLSATGLDLTGTLDGQVKATGTFASFSPDAIALAGQLQLSQVPLLKSPLATAFQWANNRLQIDRMETANLEASGWIDVPFDGWVPSLGAFDVGVTLQHLDLGQWAAVPNDVVIAGMTNFDGRIFGTVAQPNVEGQLQLDGLTLNQIQFEPLMGPVQFRRDQGLAFDLRGNRDRLSANFDPAFRPTEFELVHQFTVQTVTRVFGKLDPVQGRDRLLASIEQFPLAALNLKPAEQFQLGNVGGILNSNVAIDLTNWDWRQANPLDALDVTGKVAIAHPRLGYLSAECFQGDIRLANGIADLQNGQIRLNRSPTVNPYDPAFPASCDRPLASHEGRYTLNGRLAATPTLAFNGKIEVEQGHVQEWLKTFQLFDLQDFGRGLRPVQLNRARDITLFPLPFAQHPSTSSPVSIPPSAQPPSNTRLLQQLQRYAEIVALLDQEQRQQQTQFSLPQLQQLDGTFDGAIDVAVTPANGVMAEFKLAGEDWIWGPYNTPNQLIAQGEFANGALTFLPLRFQAGDTRLNFAGSVGWGDDATGQFQATNISVDWLRRFFKLPLNIDGNLNATAAITGNLDNPRARGSISLSDAQLNRNPIQSAAAQFEYNNARLGLLGNMQLQDDNQDAQLISLRGELPYRFPQATVEPERDDIDLQIALKDDGIGLMNLLNDQFFWEDGMGTITLDVGGTLRQTDKGFDFRPTIDGTALVESATFSAQVLPAPLTNVTGDIRFDGDRITVNTFDGRFSDGDFQAMGIIPLLTPFTPQELAALTAGTATNVGEAATPGTERPPSPSDSLGIGSSTGSSLSSSSPLLPSQQPLTLSLNALAMNLKGVYNGGVDGRINIGGTALAPELSGGLVLSDGRVSLPDPNPAALNSTVDDDENNVWSGLISPPELVDLSVTLGKDLLITQLPLLNFVATGELIVNGPLQNDMSAIAPSGVITLHSGQVNLFTTQFNLDRGHTNTATFRPGFGSDPILDVQLETSVLEDNRRRQPIATNVPQSEIADPAFDDLSQLQTIRLQAAVNGPASQLPNNIELTSSPSRSETEIVALMGGGFVDTLGRSEGFIGIANLAGTALFTRLQTLVSNAVGFSDFRVFPTIITEDDREEEGGGDIRTQSTLALAAELGLRLTDDLSVSALQLLTVEEPTQFNLRYQLEDEWLLRGSTNFSDDNRIILEFETRF